MRSMASLGIRLSGAMADFRYDATQGTFLCRLPAVTTANRLDVHFWWNAGEAVLLFLAADRFLRRGDHRSPAVTG